MIRVHTEKAVAAGSCVACGEPRPDENGHRDPDKSVLVIEFGDGHGLSWTTRLCVLCWGEMYEAVQTVLAREIAKLV